MSNKILVLGGTGKTGRRIAERLIKTNLPVIIGSRNADPGFDWEKPLTWAGALSGIETVYISFHPDIAIPRASDIIRSFVNTAIKSGVKKLVLLSGRGENACDDIIMRSGLNWTIIRCSWFMQNFNEGFLLDAVLLGEMVLPKVNALEPFVDVDDIADVAVAALTTDIHANQILELTGPELLSFEKTVSAISNTISRKINYREVSMEEYISLLKDYHTPEDIIWIVNYLFTEALDGRNESTTNDIERVLGKKPGTFENYVLKTYKTGVWNNEN